MGVSAPGWRIALYLPDDVGHDLLRLPPPVSAIPGRAGPPRFDEGRAPSEPSRCMRSRAEVRMSCRSTCRYTAGPVFPPRRHPIP